MGSLDIAGLVVVKHLSAIPDQFLEGKLITTKSGYAEITAQQPAQGQPELTSRQEN